MYIIECKCPLNPTSNFELRASLEHLDKASAQLDNARNAFSDPTFAKKYLESLGVTYKERKIHTCIIMGNRMFNGLSINNHPVRFIYELDMILNNGYIRSNIGNWRVWQDTSFSNSDLLDFLSPTSKFINSNLSSMPKIKEVMNVNGNTVSFISYEFNMLKAMSNYDKLFYIENKDEEKLNKLLKRK